MAPRWIPLLSRSHRREMVPYPSFPLPSSLCCLFRSNAPLYFVRVERRTKGGRRTNECPLSKSMSERVRKRPRKQGGRGSRTCSGTWHSCNSERSYLPHTNLRPKEPGLQQNIQPY